MPPKKPPNRKPKKNKKISEPSVPRSPSVVDCYRDDPPKGAHDPTDRPAVSKPPDWGKVLDAPPFSVGMVLSPGLYIAATPIGNAGDITLRALAALQACDLILCEDTRVTAKLLSLYGIKKAMLPYHDHNAVKVRPRILSELEAGQAIVLVSDAGTPRVSDPGYRLVREALEAGHEVTALPGASAVLSGLVLSGLPSDRFFFAGFLPVKTAARGKVLADLKSVPGTLIFFETGPRLAASLADMATHLDGREAAVARELTKKFEEVRRGGLSDLAEHYKQQGPPKGEVVVLVGPPGDKAKADDETVEAELRAALAILSVREASAQIAARFGLKRSDLYRRALALKGEAEDNDPAMDGENGDGR